MKFKIFGAQGAYESGPLINLELLSRGHKIVDNPTDEPDVIIHLTGKFGEAEEFYSNCSNKPLRIYSLLDIDPSKPISWYNDCIEHLNNCEIPCVISNTVKKDVKDKLGELGLRKDLNVWHYPIRPVHKYDGLRTIAFGYSGRIFSKNKRFNLVSETLDKLNFDKSKFITVGPEKPPFGFWGTKLNDDEVNDFFNSIMYLISPSETEGMNLNILQAVITDKAIPIVTNDCEVIYEWGLEKFAADPTPAKLSQKIADIENNVRYYYDILDELAPSFNERFQIGGVVDKLEKMIKEYNL